MQKKPCVYVADICTAHVRCHGVDYASVCCTVDVRWSQWNTLHHCEVIMPSLTHLVVFKFQLEKFCLSVFIVGKNLVWKSVGQIILGFSHVSVMNWKAECFVIEQCLLQTKWRLEKTWLHQWPLCESGRCARQKRQRWRHWETNVSK